MTDINKIESNMEVEYKFWAGNLSKEDFHARIEHLRGELIEPLYVVSCDDYYTSGNPDVNGFLRYRKGGSTHELTLKVKRQENVIRKEINLDITGNDDSAVVEFLKLSGYHKSFSIFKEAWIWHFEDCDVSYYTLPDGRSFIELEATKYSKVSQGVEIIDQWKHDLGLDELRRESRSLFEIFTDDQSLADDVLAGEREREYVITQDFGRY